MKDKCFILFGNPGTSALTDPGVQSFDDAEGHDVVECAYAADPAKCSPPCFGCIRVAGARIARAVLRLYPEASETTLVMEREHFRRRGALPPKAVMAYVDPERGFEHITDPERVVQRVWEHARAVLNLKPGERVPRWERPCEAVPSGVPPFLLRHSEQGTKGGKPGKVARAEIARQCASAAGAEAVPVA